MSDWRSRACAELVARARTRLVHGSEARDVMQECGAPGALIDNHEAEKLLEIALEPWLEHGPAPSLSQRAFLGLQYRKLEYVPGCRECWYFRLKPVIQHVMYLREPTALLVEERNGVTQRHVWVHEAHTIRGQAGMYPMLPDVEPVTIDRETFEEAWGVG